MEIKDILNFIGDKSSEAITKFLKILAELGVNLTETQGKIISFIITLGAIFLIIKFVERPLKWLIIALLILLLISIGISFVPLT